MKPQSPVVAPDQVLTREDVARWLQVEPRQVERLGVPCLVLGRKTIRYFKADVQAWIDEYRAKSTASGSNRKQRAS